jgi:heme O synthase-like polyprenyltransferase
MVPVIALVGSFARLAVVVAILVVLGLWTPLNMLAMLLAFIVSFTVLNGVWLYTLATKRRGVPPGAGASGAR